MEAKSTEEFIAKQKEIVADIILKFNEVEYLIKTIISIYISSDKKEFIDNVLLNNLILSFSSKNNILKYIIENNNKLTDNSKKLKDSIKNLMGFRNIVAHSDNLIDYNVTIEEDLFSRYILKIPRYMSSMNVKKVESKAQITLNDGKILSSEIGKLHSDFLKHYKIVSSELKLIIERLKN